MHDFVWIKACLHNKIKKLTLLVASILKCQMKIWPFKWLYFTFSLNSFKGDHYWKFIFWTFPLYFFQKILVSPLSFPLLFWKFWLPPFLLISPPKCKNSTPLLWNFQYWHTIVRSNSWRHIYIYIYLCIYIYMYVYLYIYTYIYCKIPDVSPRLILLQRQFLGDL